MTGDELQQARKRLGLSGSDFAKVMEVTTRTLRGWESGSRDGKPCPVPAPIALLTELALKSRNARNRLGIAAIVKDKRRKFLLDNARRRVAREAQRTALVKRQIAQSQQTD